MPEMEKPLSDLRALAGDSSDKGFGNALRHGERIAALGTCKQRSREMYKYLKDQGSHEFHDRLAADLGGCANYLVFHNYYTVDQIRLAKARTCKKHLLCPFCARARGAKLLEKTLPKFHEITDASPHLIPAMLTMTVKNGPDLEERFEHLVSSFRRLQKRRRDWQQKGRGWTEFAKVEGALFSYEFTYSEEQGWHPHLHALVMLNSYIDFEALKAEWHAITGDSFIIELHRLQGEPVDAMQEVFKYAMKFADLPLDKNLHAFETLRGKRLMGSFGCFHGVKVPESLTDELLEDLPYIEMFYQYSPQKRSYELQEATKKDFTPRVTDEPREYEIVKRPGSEAATSSPGLSTTSNGDTDHACNRFSQSRPQPGKTPERRSRRASGS
jgi:hypothetical protein